MTKINLSNDVTVFLSELNHPFIKEIQILREYILASNNDLTENIKWNAPNYCSNNEDRITMRIQPPTKLQLIFHCGAKVKEQPKEKIIKDDFGILTWKGNDRAIANFKNIQDIQSKKDDLAKIIVEWIKATKSQ